MKSRALKNYDLIAAVVGLIIGVAVITAHFVRMQHEYLITLGSVLVVACLFYLVFRKKLLIADGGTHLAKDSRSHILLINSIFLLLFTASIYTLQTQVFLRPMSYFLLTSAACATIAVEIALCPGGRTQIYSTLGKILLVALSLRCSQYFGFAGIVGIDPWAHHVLISDLILLGHVPEIRSWCGALNPYLNYPLMHIYVGMMGNVSACSIKEAMFLAAALPEILSIIFVFLLGRELIGAKGALYASLLISFSNFHIQWGTQIIAMTFGVALVSLAVYLVMSRQAWSQRPIVGLIVILLFAAVIFTHILTAFILFVSLFALFVTAKLYRLFDRVGIRVRHGSFTLLALFTVGMLSQWMYVTWTKAPFFSAFVSSFASSVAGSAVLLYRPQVVSELAPLPLYQSILDISGFAILFGLGVIGSLLWLSNRHKDISRVSLIGMLVLLFMVPFSYSLFGIRHVLPYRWFVFMYIPLTIIASFAIVQLLALFTRASSRILYVAIITLVLSFFMITSTISNTDSPIYKKGFTNRLLYTSQEMGAAERITGFYDGRIIYDGLYSFPFTFYYNYRGEKSRLEESWLKEGLPEGMLIWREHMDKGPIFIAMKDFKLAPFTLEEDYEEQVAMERMLIYSNSEVRAYLSK